MAGAARIHTGEATSGAETSLQESEKDLIRRAVAGDARAFHQLVDAHADYLYSVACAMLGKGPDAEDVVQDAFIAAMKGLRHFEGRAALRTWLVAITVRQVAVLRRKKRALEPLHDEAVTDPSGHRDAASADARMDVMHVLQQLSPEHREILILRELEGMSYEAIAGALGVPRGTVESRLFRARQEIRNRFGEFSQEGKENP